MQARPRFIGHVGYGGSVFLSGKEIPMRFYCQAIGPSVPFVIPPKWECKKKMIDVCVVYGYNNTKALSHMWVGHFGDFLLKDADRVVVVVHPRDGLNVKECGVHLCDQSTSFVGSDDNTFSHPASWDTWIDVESNILTHVKEYKLLYFDVTFHINDSKSFEWNPYIYGLWPTIHDYLFDSLCHLLISWLIDPGQTVPFKDILLHGVYEKQLLDLFCQLQYEIELNKQLQTTLFKDILQHVLARAAEMGQVDRKLFLDSFCELLGCSRIELDEQVVEVKMTFRDKKSECKSRKTVSGISGVVSICGVQKALQLTVVGGFELADIARKLEQKHYNGKGLWRPTISIKIRVNFLREEQLRQKIKISRGFYRI